jgi:glycosyltransferase involved in cell wall biosynthesis
VPQALMQAMSCAIPCVTTSAGAIPEIARDRDTAYVGPPEDPLAHAATIDDVLDHPDAAASTAERARAFVLARYGLGPMLDRMEAAFRRALEGARR